MQEKKILRDQIDDLCFHGLYEDAVALITDKRDIYYLSRIIIRAFEYSHTTDTSINFLLNTYLQWMDSKDSSKLRYCLIWFMHFEMSVWKNVKIEWLKQYYRLALLLGLNSDDKVKNELNSVISGFANHARWDDNPLDFGFFPSLMQNIGSRFNDNDYIVSRLTRIFTSEEDLLLWRLSRKFGIGAWDSDAQAEDLPSLVKIEKMLLRIKEIRGNVGMAKAIVEENIELQRNESIIIAGRVREQDKALFALDISRILSRRLIEFKLLSSSI